MKVQAQLSDRRSVRVAVDLGHERSVEILLNLNVADLAGGGRRVLLEAVSNPRDRSVEAFQQYHSVGSMVFGLDVDLGVFEGDEEDEGEGRAALHRGLLGCFDGDQAMEERFAHVGAVGACLCRDSGGTSAEASDGLIADGMQIVLKFGLYESFIRVNRWFVDVSHELHDNCVLEQ